MAGHGSAESSRAARPRWVMMELSRVARASTAERSGSSSGACCRRNDRTSDPSRPRASTTKGVSSACGFFSGGYRFRLCSSRSLAALPGGGLACGNAHGGVVTLMTLHTAKGLEFPVVFLTGMEFISKHWL